MSKVVLAAIHSKYIHSALAPWCLAAAVEEYCLFPHQVLVREGTINQPDEKLLELLYLELDRHPTVIAPSAAVFARYSAGGRGAGGFLLFPTGDGGLP